MFVEAVGGGLYCGHVKDGEGGGARSGMLPRPAGVRKRGRVLTRRTLWGDGVLSIEDHHRNSGANLLNGKKDYC